MVYEVSRWQLDLGQVSGLLWTSEAVVTEEKEKPQLMVPPALILGPLRTVSS